MKNPSDDIVRCHVCDTVCRNSNTQQCTECQHQTCKGCFESGSDRTLCQTCTAKDVSMQPRCGSSRTSTISFVYAGDLNHHTAAQNFGIPNSVKHLQQNKKYRLDEGMVRCVSMNVPPCSIKEPSLEAYRAAMNQPSEECVLRKVSVLTTCNTRGEMCVSYADNMEPISVDNPRFNTPPGVFLPVAKLTKEQVEERTKTGQMKPKFLWCNEGLASTKARNDAKLFALIAQRWSELVARREHINLPQATIQKLDDDKLFPTKPPIHGGQVAVSYTHLRAHETREDLVCRLLLEKKK